MKKKVSKGKPLRILTIEEIIQAADSKHGKEFNIFNNEELRIEPNISIPFRLDHFTIILVSSGKVDMRLNLIDYVIPANSLIICSPNTTLEFLSDIRKTSFYAVDFSIQLLTESALNNKYIEAFGVFTRNDMPVYQLLPEEVQNIKAIMQLLYVKNKLPQDHPFISELLLNLFKVFFFEIAAALNDEIVNQKIQLNSKELLVKRFYGELTANFKVRRDVEFYAEKLHVTPKYLTKCVKELVGKSSSEIIAQMVIVEAKIMLSNLSDPISHIAEELTFSDQFFFSKFFKRVAGVSPSEYRSLLNT